MILKHFQKVLDANWTPIYVLDITSAMISEMGSEKILEVLSEIIIMMSGIIALWIQIIMISEFFLECSEAASKKDLENNFQIFAL